MAPLSIGFIGTGGISGMHANGMKPRPDLFQLKAVADISEAGRTNFADKNAIPDRHADYRRIIADPGIDAVVVLLPHHLHEEACVAAFAAGKHVLVEKPIARTLAEADRIIAAGQRSGRVLMVGHNQRYDPQLRRIRELVEQGRLGKLFCGRADHYQNFNPPAGSWWRSREAVGGGCVIGSGIHRLDLLRWYLGEVEEVYAALTYDPARLEAEVACAATLRFQNGAIAEFLINWGACHNTYCESIGVWGQDGSVTRFGWGEPAQLATPDRKLTPLEPSAGDTMWEHFHRCITSGAAPLTSGAEGRAALALVLAIIRAGETNKPVRLDTLV